MCLDHIWNLDREAKFKNQSRVGKDETGRAGLSEVNDGSQRGACDWSCSQGCFDDSDDGHIFANEGIGDLGKVFNNIPGSKVRTQGPAAISPRCLARHSATKARQECDGGRGGQNQGEGEEENREGWVTVRGHIRIKEWGGYDAVAVRSRIPHLHVKQDVRCWLD